jgi:hypothetical protein
LQELIRRAPDFGPGHGMRCMQLLGGVRYAAAADQGPQRDAAVDQCRRAIELDPQLGVGHRGLAGSEDGRQWARREAILRTPVAKNKDPDVDAALGEFLGQAGRLDEGISLMQGVTAKRGWTVYAGDLGYALLTSSRADEARQFLSTRLALRPSDSGMRLLNFLAVAYRGKPEDALLVLDDPSRRPQDLPPPAIAAYRAFLTAKRTGAAADRQKAIDTVMATVGSISPLRAHAVPLLSELGALDEAFKVAEAYSTDPAVVRFGFTMAPNFLYGPETVAMRADPRFISVARNLGLLAYWRSSAHWPDFCTQEPRSVCAQMRREAGAA